MQPESGFEITPNWLYINQKNDSVAIRQHDIITKFFALTMFLLSL